MSLVIVVEDGSGTNTAVNSFVTIDEVKAYADARGLTLPPSDDDIARLLINAKDYLISLEKEYCGVRSKPSTQQLCFPRKMVFLYGQPLPSDEIPQIIKDAQCQLASDNFNYGDLQPVDTGRVATMEKVDVIQVQYADGGASTPQPTFTKAISILDPLLCGGQKSGGAFGFARVTRV